MSLESRNKNEVRKLIGERLCSNCGKPIIEHHGLGFTRWGNINYFCGGKWRVEERG